MYSIPGVSDFKTLFDRDFPFSTTAIQATALVVANAAGQVVQVNPNERGAGYTSAPRVTITDADDGPGIGATATANLTSNGQVGSYTVTSPGSGYLNPVAAVRGGGVDDTNMNFVRDTDINRALLAAGINFNQALWSNQQNFNYAFLLKAAHFLCVNLRASSQGLRGRGGQWLQNSFTVGDISAAYDIAPRVKESKILAPLLETTYGCQYLQILSPQLVGNVRSVIGHTKP